jgi:hypothetical protein
MAKIGASVDSDPSMSPVMAGCTRCRSNVADDADDADDAVLAVSLRLRASAVAVWLSPLSTARPVVVSMSQLCDQAAILSNEDERCRLSI